MSVVQPVSAGRPLFEEYLAKPLRTAASRAVSKLRWKIDHMPARMVEHGAPPALFGWKWLRREPLQAYLRRDLDAALLEEVHQPSRFTNPLPRNVRSRDNLDRDGALWGYSMHDVPDRASAPTLIAKVPRAKLYFFQTADKRDFFPGLVSRDGRALQLREIDYRPPHALQRARSQPRRVEQATWILERCYHNHSHWLTAHLPKFLLLKDRDALGRVLLPERRTAVMDASLELLGLDPRQFPTFSEDVPLAIEELTIVTTDRFRPELVRSVRQAFPRLADGKPARRVFISRARSRGRRLLNEKAIWPVLRANGFEMVHMEELTFAEQVKLMQETSVLLAPHGAGLTNMIFCPEGAHIIEIADPGFPNPNFYALSSAMGQHYWLVHGKSVGSAASRLDRDLEVDVDAVSDVLDQIE